MHAAYVNLRETFPKMIYITCLAHGLNRVAEQVRAEFIDVNKLIAHVKLCFVKAPSRTRIFKEMLGDVPLPPQPILTRFGTWIRAAFYYADHFEEIKTVINSLNKDDFIHIEV